MSDSDFFEQNSEPVKYSQVDSLEVNLSSAGKLSAPPTLRVTDYTMEDTAKLASANGNNIIKLLIEVLQARIQEDFDVRLLHENEFEEILFSIYVNFWNTAFLDYPFPWKEEDLVGMTEAEADKIRSGEKKLKVNIDLTQVQVDEISEDFKEPIIISQGEKKVGLRLPRVGDLLLADEKTKEKFAVQDKRFSDLRFLMNQGGSLDSIKDKEKERLGPFIEHEKERGMYFFSLKNALLIQFVEENGVKRALTTMEEKYHEYKKMPRKLWNAFLDATEKIKFGVNHDVKVVSPITNEIVTRRCLFQVLDYIPSDELSDSSGYSVQFGD